MSKKLKVGDTIPSFALPNHLGELIHVSPTDHKWRIIYFYPKNNTRICTKQACSFNDWYEDLMDLNIELIGISSDTPEQHLQFKSKYNLNFLLLSDESKEIRKLFGAGKFLNNLSARITYLMNEEGKIVYIYDAFWQGKKHIENLKYFINKKF